MTAVANKPRLAPVQSKCLCNEGRDDWTGEICDRCRGTGIREREAKHEARGLLHTFRIPSNTRPHLSYTVHYVNGFAACNCEATVPLCDHKRRVIEAMEATMERTGTEIATRGDTPMEVFPPKSILPSAHELALIKGISNAVARASGGGFVPQHIKTPEQAAVIMLYGWELGLRPMTALQHVFLINGRAALSAQAMMGIVRAKIPGARFEIVRSDSEVCTMRLHLPGEPPAELSYTKQMAQDAGQLAKQGPWHTYRPDMLRWTVAKRLCRLFAPHVINSIDGSLISDRMATADALIVEPAIAEDVPQLTDIPIEAYNPGDSVDGSQVEARDAELETVEVSFDTTCPLCGARDLGHCDCDPEEVTAAIAKRDFEAATAAGQEPLL